VTPEEQITKLRAFEPAQKSKLDTIGPPCLTGGCTVLSCIRQIEDLIADPAIAMSRINVAKCRFHKGNGETSCPPGGKA
jgi:hypothetical protein